MSKARYANVQPLFAPPTIASAFAPDAEVVVAPGDCLETLSAMPRGSAQLIITSPPYNIGKNYENATDLDRYLRALAPIVDELVRVLGSKGSLCWQVGNYVKDSEVFPLDIFYYPFFRKHGLKLRNRIVWHFAHGLHATKRFSGRYEVLLWFTKGDAYTFNLDDVRVPSKYYDQGHFAAVVRRDTHKLRDRTETSWDRQVRESQRPDAGFLRRTGGIGYVELQCPTFTRHACWTSCVGVSVKCASFLEASRCSPSRLMRR